MITEYLTSGDGSFMTQPEVTAPNSGYRMVNDAGVECEVGEFLYGMARILQPNNVFETGTHEGIASSYIAQALKDNKKGLLTTVEIEKQHIRKAQERWNQLELDKWVICDKENSLEYDLEYNCEMMFLDSEPYLRFNELRRFYPRLLPGGFVFIHDTPRNLCQGNFNPDHPTFKSWPFGDINQEVHEWVLDHELTPFHFPTPRGLVGFYRRHYDDYRWGRPY